MSRNDQLNENDVAAYLFQLDYLQSGQVVYQERLKWGDFAQAVNAVCLDGLRQGLLADYQPRPDTARIHPIFASEHEAELAARLSGFSVGLPLEDGSTHEIRFDLKYFAAKANRVQAQLLRQGRLDPDVPLHYWLSAFLDDAGVRHGSGAFELGPATSPVSVQAGCRADWEPTEPIDHPDDRDLPVTISREVLEEALQETGDHPEQEVGGLLLGHLRREPQPRGELFLVVTGLVSSVASAEASGTSFTFTPESFAHARRMIGLRGTQDREEVVGWYHSHPFRLCAECPLPTPKECIDQKILFYSLDDHLLMESTFPHAYMVGLLTSLEPRVEQALGHLPVRLFGYRQGQIVPRGFEVMRP